MRVFLIEDDEDLRFATTLALKTGGYTTVALADCDAAVNELESSAERPAAILMDVQLDSGMSPAAFVSWLRAHGYGEVPVLVVSARLDTAQIARDLGVSGYLSKPFDINTLLSRVREVAAR